MHLSILVVDSDAVVQALGYLFVVYDNLFGSCLGIHHKLKDVEKLSSVPAGLAEQSISFFYIYLTLLQHLIFLQCTVQKKLQVIDFQALQHIHLAAGQEGSNNLEGRVLGSCTYQHNRACFNSSKQRVLLCLVETMDFVYEEHGSRRLGEYPTGFGGIYDIPHILDTGTDGA